jgi:hypothetical protein
MLRESVAGIEYHFLTAALALRNSSLRHYESTDHLRSRRDDLSGPLPDLKSAPLDPGEGGMEDPDPLLLSNVVAIGLADRRGVKFTFYEFARTGLMITLLSTAVANLIMIWAFVLHP